MKIRTQITLSFTVMIVIVSVSLMFLSNSTLDTYAELNDKSTRTAIETVTDETCRTSEEILVSFGEKLLAMETSDRAHQVSELFKQIKQQYDYSEIRKSPLFNDIRNSPIYSMGKEVGRYYIVDYKAECVLYPKGSSEELGFVRTKKDYPELEDSIKYTFRKNKLSAEFKLKGKHGEADPKLLVIKQINDSPYKLCAIIDPDMLFREVHEKITSVGEKAKMESINVKKNILRQMKNHYENMSMLYSIIILCCGVIYGIWFGNYIAKPIAHLHEAIMELKKGNLSVRLKEAGSSETRLVTKTFNDMTTFLKRENVEQAIRQSRKK